MQVELLSNTQLHIAARAIRTCWQSQDKSDTKPVPKCIHCGSADESYFEIGMDDEDLCTRCGSINSISYDHIECGPNDKALIDRVGNKFKHASTLEHLSYTFYISGVSRALLQELARHRMASLSVKSSRYTLGELKKEAPFYDKGTKECAYATIRATKYIVFTGNSLVDYSSIEALDKLRITLNQGVSNDIAKYCLPESYKTELTWTINARSLQNFIALRSNKSALWEIRDLSQAIFDALPEDHKYLFEDSLYTEDSSAY